ncbi:hypothetical protein F2Q68_00010828 [Brassica cretica]|uniref:Uncharacterized protein n=1 Tax=Brassica cretica TaxID=69181 RepID=A0A8S9KZE9_BRACR|nr:hypothetical protein F2Q68_00010828 [Brassica cretica]
MPSLPRHSPRHNLQQTNHQPDHRRRRHPPLLPRLFPQRLRRLDPYLLHRLQHRRARLLDQPLPPRRRLRRRRQSQNRPRARLPQHRLLLRHHLRRDSRPPRDRRRSLLPGLPRPPRLASLESLSPRSPVVSDLEDHSPVRVQRLLRSGDGRSQWSALDRILALQRVCGPGGPEPYRV